MRRLPVFFTALILTTLLLAGCSIPFLGNIFGGADKTDDAGEMIGLDDIRGADGSIATGGGISGTGGGTGDAGGAYYDTDGVARSNSAGSETLQAPFSHRSPETAKTITWMQRSAAVYRT